MPRPGDRRTPRGRRTAGDWIEDHQKGGETMDKKSGGKPTYAGRIGNSGAQMVKAPFPANGPKGKTTSKTGDDLRSGKK